MISVELFKALVASGGPLEHNLGENKLQWRPVHHDRHSPQDPPSPSLGMQLFPPHIQKEDNIAQSPPPPDGGHGDDSEVGPANILEFSKTFQEY